MTGSLASNCSPPCTTTHSSTILGNNMFTAAPLCTASCRILAAGGAGGEYHCGVPAGGGGQQDGGAPLGYSALQWGVQVDQFSLMDSLNFLGSNFGLWPGLGICQLVEWGLLRLPGLTHLAS